MSDAAVPQTLRPWRTVSSQQVLDCGIFTIHKVNRESDDGNKGGDFYTIDSRDWVNVLAITPDERMIIIRQYRHGSDEISIEIPGGIVDQGESPIEAARRELLEETGFDSSRLVELGRVRANPAFMTNWMYYVLALDVHPVGETSFDDWEEISMELLPIPDVDEMVRRGDITHAYAVAALLWYRVYRQRQTQG